MSDDCLPESEIASSIDATLKFSATDVRIETVNDLLKKEMGLFCAKWQQLELPQSDHNTFVEFQELTKSIPLFDDIQSGIYGSSLQSMKLRQDLSFAKDMEQYLYTRAPQLSSKIRSSLLTSIKSEPSVHLNIDETIMCCAIYGATESVLFQEVEVCSSQTLYDLACTINNANQFCSPNSSLNGSHFFFINGVFYIDKPLESGYSSDDSHPTISKIISWLKSTHQLKGTISSQSKKTDFGSHPNNPSMLSIGEAAADQSFTDWLTSLGIDDVDSIPIKSMHAMTIKDLTGISLTTRYLYCHRGCCEHQIAFSSCRQWHPALDADPNCYPRVAYRRKQKRKRCSVCDANVAKFVVHGDRLAELNPCYYCEYCYHMLHYDENGVLLYNDFVVHPCGQD